MMTLLSGSSTPVTAMLGFSLPGGGEWIILLILGLLIFGRRLPEVGRSLGRGIVEFKKGIRGVEEEIEEESRPAKKISDQPRAELPKARSRAEEDESFVAAEKGPREGQV